LTPDARSDSIFSAENEDDATLAASASPRKKRGIKITDETRKFLENENILRRSGRQRRENSGTNASEQRPLKRPLSHSEEISDEEEEEGEFEITPMLPKTTQKSLKALPKKKVRKHSANSNGDSDGARPARRNKPEARKNRINYRDISSGEEINSDDVLEWDEGGAAGASEQNASGSETIEKVLRHRAGYPGATGASTTLYNVEDRGDPNVRLGEAGSNAELERQYLIKWLGWSHLHNTWESESSLKACNAKGLKKIDNYMKRLREIEEW
uniref:Chromo domain-containing protein n=1 Tax=Gongylonema pulchrum TaxID=637853 RepID=A0A183E9S4_9BILA